MIFSPGFAFWILFIGSAVCMYFKRYKLLLPPIVLFRYDYPLCICIPIITAVLFNKTETFKMDDD